MGEQAGDKNVSLYGYVVIFLLLGVLGASLAGYFISHAISNELLQFWLTTLAQFFIYFITAYIIFSFFLIYNKRCLTNKECCRFYLWLSIVIVIVSIVKTLLLKTAFLSKIIDMVFLIVPSLFTLWLALYFNLQISKNRQIKLFYKE